MPIPGLIVRICIHTGECLFSDQTPLTSLLLPVMKDQHAILADLKAKGSAETPHYWFRRFRA